MFFRCSQHAKCKRFQTFPLHFSNSQVIRLDQTFHNLPKNVLWSCLARLIFFGMLLTSLKFASTVLSWPYPKNISLIEKKIIDVKKWWFWGSEVCYEVFVLSLRYAMSLKYCMKKNLTWSVFAACYYALVNLNFLENLVFKKILKNSSQMLSRVSLSKKYITY